ncbi:MAG: dethiobiotin synthase [Candidatus Calescibacterium sp.]|jgi:dethiobiotin synthase|nr:dethiobiotin synthase [Candidatus Calescibacterium sp.]
MGSIFITGIGTEVGKTIFSAILLAKFKGKRTFYFKPVETGGQKPMDFLFCSKFADFSEPPIYHFKTPASPHIAAKIENQKINIQKIKEKIKEIERKGFNLIIEGAGGLLVPLRQKPLYTWRDLITELKLPTLVVSASYLGAINHTLLTVEALKKINLVGVVLNFPKPPKTVAEKTNKETLKKILGELYLGEIYTIPPHIKNRLTKCKVNSLRSIIIKISNVRWQQIKKCLF